MGLVFRRTSTRKLSEATMFECINKLRSSKFWLALEAFAAPNPINMLFMSNDMIKDITAAKNVFGHQASGGVCSKGDGGLCVCRALMDRLFDHAKNPKFNTEQALLRLVCANIPSGIGLNFPQHAQMISAAVDAFFATHPNAMQAFEPSVPGVPTKLDEPTTGIETLPRKGKAVDKRRSRPTKKPKTNAAEKSTDEEVQSQAFFNPNLNAGFGAYGVPSPYCTASVHVTHTSYGPNHVQRVVANFSVGGVPMNDLFNQLNSLFASR